jgi:prevent-host-death family protein
MMQSVSIDEAHSGFSEILSQVEAGQRVLIRRREQPLAVLISVKDMEHLERAAQVSQRLALALGQDQEILDQIAERHAHPAMAAFGLWRDVPELATLADDIAVARQSAPVRTPP